MYAVRALGLTHRSRRRRCRGRSLTSCCSARSSSGWVSFRVIEQPTGKLRMLRDRDGRPREYYPELSVRRAR